MGGASCKYNKDCTTDYCLPCIKISTSSASTDNWSFEYCEYAQEQGDGSSSETAKRNIWNDNQKAEAKEMCAAGKKSDKNYMLTDD